MKKIRLTAFMAFALLIACTPPLSAPLPTATILPTATVLPTNTPAPTATPAPTNTALPKSSATPTAMATEVIQPMQNEIRHLNDLGLLPGDFFGRRPNSVTMGDYYYTLHPNIAPDTIIERLNSFPGFNGPVIHVKIGNAPPPNTNDLQRAYVNVERSRENQIKGPWGYEYSFLLQQVPNRLDNSGASERPIYSMASLLMHLPNSSFRAAGGIRLFSEGGKYYASVYRVNRPDRPASSAATMVDSRRVEIKIGVKQGFRIELNYNAKDNNKPYIKAYLVSYSQDGLKKIGYQFIGELPFDSDITEIMGDITWLGAYVGVPVRDLELVSGEAAVFAIK